MNIWVAYDFFSSRDDRWVYMIITYMSVRINLKAVPFFMRIS